MKIRFFLFASILLCTFSLHAQVGTGPAPTLNAVRDKFPSLSWTASTSTVSGYNVYRGIVAGGTKGRVNTALVTTLTYRDATAAFGTQNFYVVEAVNSSGVESVPSNEVSATAVQGSPAPPTGLNAVLAFLEDVGKAIFAALKFVGSGFLG